MNPTSLNQDLNNWNVSSENRVCKMFQNALLFNRNNINFADRPQIFEHTVEEDVHSDIDEASSTEEQDNDEVLDAEDDSGLNNENIVENDNASNNGVIIFHGEENVNDNNNIVDPSIITFNENEEKKRIIKQFKEDILKEKDYENNCNIS